MRQYVAYLVVLLLLLAANAGNAIAVSDPNDDFGDGVLDTTKWFTTLYPDASGSTEERDGRLVMTRGTGDYYRNDLRSQWMFRGAFDVQVDYQILQWPESRYLGIVLAVTSADDYSSIVRYQNTGSNAYAAGYLHSSDCVCGGNDASADTTGTLRLVRDAEGNLTGYYWSAGTSSWVAFSSAVMPGDVRISLAFDTVADQPAQVAFDNFRANSGEMILPPVITDVVLDRGRDTDWWDWSMWHTRFTVQVKGTADEQPAMLLVEEPQGSRYVIHTDGGYWWDPGGTNLGGSCDVRVTAGPDNTYTFTWYEARKQYPIPEGSYRITVVGSAGSQPTLTTPVLPAVPEEGPALSGPAADSVIDSTAPTFEWTPLPGAQYTLKVRAEGATNYTGPPPEQDDCGQIWRVAVSPTGPASVVYGFDGMGPDLEPGRTYFWEVDAWTPVDDRVSDPRVSIWTEQTARHRFTVNTTWPTLPDLPGRLAYEQTMYGDTSDPYNLQAILQYGTTPSERTWVGPDASHTPSYSWDGTKIAYRVSDWGIRVANADGSDPVRLPNMWGWYGADFSPDATWVTYADGEWQGSDPQHIFIQKLFEPERTLLVRSRGDRAWDPHWSPDGVWISYLSCCDPSGSNVWLIHPDGTDEHPVVITGVAGHPGATVNWFSDTPAWSPDAKRLLTRVSFTTAEGQDLSAMGTVSRDGGDFTPVWIDPSGVVCCAAAFPETWSPDGNSIVFSSAHHLPVDVDWINGRFEPGVELWMIDADGTGEPTRLTYDYSNNPSAAWWAPNTAVGSNIAITRGEATVTFETVSAEGSTAVFVTADSPGAMPEGFTAAGDYWEVLTNAGHSGGVWVELRYLPAETEEATLRLLAWDGEEWKNVTTSIDAANHVVQGAYTALSHFTLATVPFHFDDVAPDYWAFGAIAACVDAGIVQGYWDETYRPEIEVTRGQMAVYIARALAGGEAHVPTGAMSASFEDVPSDHWAYKYAEYCAGNDIVVGYWDGTYRPDEVVNRGQMAVYVARSVADPIGDAGVPDIFPEDPIFPDVGIDHWAYRYIEYCASLDIVQGYWDGNYHPDWEVTRDQMAVYVQRAFELPL